MPLSAYQQIQQVKDHYNAIGLHFAETRKKRLWPEILPFIREIKRGMRVLDVGCGSGRLLSELKGKKIFYKGIDFSKTLLNQAKAQYPKRLFLLKDITLPKSWEKMGKYDAIFCFYSHFFVRPVFSFSDTCHYCSSSGNFNPDRKDSSFDYWRIKLSAYKPRSLYSYFYEKLQVGSFDISFDTYFCRNCICSYFKAKVSR